MPWAKSNEAAVHIRWLFHNISVTPACRPVSCRREAQADSGARVRGFANEWLSGLTSASRTGLLEHAGGFWCYSYIVHANHRPPAAKCRIRVAKEKGCRDQAEKWCLANRKLFTRAPIKTSHPKTKASLVKSRPRTELM